MIQVKRCDKCRRTFRYGPTFTREGCVMDARCECSACAATSGLAKDVADYAMIIATREDKERVEKVLADVVGRDPYIPYHVEETTEAYRELRYGG
jgi:hypothetical protein